MSFSIGSQIGSAIRSIGASIDSTPHPAPPVKTQPAPTPSNPLNNFVATHGLHLIAGGQAQVAAHGSGVTDVLHQALDDLSDTSQELSFDIQTAMQQMSQADSATSNLQKKLQDAANASIGNIRG